MVKEKVGRDDWKQLKVGETGVFTLPDLTKGRLSVHVLLLRM